ncbi:hypothetical protein QA584_15670 [Anaerocolumna sp. AGMB13025]|uniref:hypothetical protein n=1 Tax=Anaerocolumna sp. AGMB13025 TaxID=3039116 RepID=UPI00241F4B18|nr:hypothetical protein [Anaerocolumna sp. AGMB13025]WFR55049.1 hypothetical protein QA584_15670 [Anaerocolumna sp. AGMB13025]
MIDDVRYAISNRIQFVDIHVIGYPVEGESIILFLRDDKENIVYTMVIDSFKKGKTNRTIDILKSHKVDKVNLLIWSHTDYDHSFGLLEILDHYIKENSVVLIPHSIFDRKGALTKYSKSVVDKLKDLLASDVQIEMVAEQKFSVFFNNAVSEEQIELSVTTLLPNSKHLLMKSTKNSTYCNDYSIACNVQINSTFNYFFAGDIIDEAILRIQKNIFPKSLSFLKIPHHGSITSTELIDLFDKKIKIPISCSTNYTKQRLPMNEVLEQYSTISKKVHITGKNDKDLNTDSYGEWYYRYNLVDMEPIKAQKQGNALEFVV